MKDQEEKDIKNNEIPDELYAPIGNVTFKKTIDGSSAVPVQKKTYEKIATDKNAEPELMSYKDVKLEYAKKPLNYKKLVRIILVLVFLVIISIISFLYLKNKKNIFFRGINDIYTTATTKVFDLKNIDLIAYDKKNTFKTSILTSVDATYDEEVISDELKSLLTTLDNIAISETLDVDYEYEKFTNTFRATLAKENIFEIGINGYDKQIDYKIKNVLGKYISVPVKYYSKFFENDKATKKNIKALEKQIVKEISKNIKEQDFKEENIKFNINGGTLKTRKITYELTKEEANEFLIKILESLKNNKKFVSEASQFFELTETRMKEVITEKINKQKENNIIEKDLKFTVYSTGLLNKIVGYELTLKDDTNKTVITKIETNNTLNIKITNNGEEILVYKQDYTQTKKTKTEIDYKEYKLTIDKDKQEDAIIYTFELTNQKEKTELSGEIILSEESKTKAIAKTIRTGMSYFNSNYDAVFTLNISTNISLKKTESMTLLDDEGLVIKYSELTKDDKEEIIKRITNNEYILDLTEQINNIKNKQTEK